jgi:hypothetical protein
MKQILLFSLLFVFSLSFYPQQKSIPRIDQMPDFPSPYFLRDWKKVAVDYDNFVFDTELTGTYLPLTAIYSGGGINYPEINPIRMDTYVGQKNHGSVAEAINIIPAIVGASLVGIDKTAHLQTNWVLKVKDFFNRKNGQNVYLNNYSTGTGRDWWYETMPNVFFYQLLSLYPNIDPDFQTQFHTIAERQLDVVYKLGGTLQPWQYPNMNYRAFNLLTGKPLTTGVPEPEAAGAIAWILYQAYIQTQEGKYKQGAELALDFLHHWTSNPSYEIQLPYGIATAARMNAMEDTQFDMDKMLNWTFSSGAGTLRGWGCIVGDWNGQAMHGLIGEANDKGNDYAFSMNGFQHAAALAPVAKYDKRYASAMAKWLLNLTNSSRYFYWNGLPQANQEVSSYSWAQQQDTDACIPYEAIKENWGGIRPFAMGDAVKGDWAATNLSLYSGSSVGYLAALIEKTNVDGILQIDLNKTDFRTGNAYPVYLYYNPHEDTKNVILHLTNKGYDIYDAISETVIESNASGEITFEIAAGSVRLLVLCPAGSTLEMETKGHFLITKEGEIIDYHYNYNYTKQNKIRVKEAFVYPNPFRQSIRIQLPGNELVRQVEIIDLNGRRIQLKQTLESDGSIVLTDNIQLEKGVYILKIRTINNQNYITKLVKN